MQLDKSKIAAAKLILAKSSAVISKATRSGFTTSAAAALDEMGIPALIVAPTSQTAHPAASCGACSRRL